MAKMRGTIVVDTDHCKGCCECVVACPKDVLAMSEKVNGMGYHYSYMIKESDCIGCISCGLVCPDSCITVYKITDDADR